MPFEKGNKHGKGRKVGSKNKITKAIQELYSEEFKSKLVDLDNPYGNGGASDLIINTLETISFDNLLKKQFHDLEQK